MDKHIMDIKKKYPQLNHFIEEIVMPIEQGRELAQLMQKSIINKLEGNKSTLKMINTHVHELPDRKQNGICFGIDLGGSNLRVLAVKFTNGQMTKKIEYETIDNSILKGHSYQLFDLISMVLERCSRHYYNKAVVDLKTVGFTFSFPVNQHSLTSGTLIHWTKGFDTKGVVGQDISQLLMHSIATRTNVTCDNVALLNDTVGTMLCGAQLYDDVGIGFIMGTGCNACYMENNKYFTPTHSTTVNGISHDDEVIVNTEFGSFGSDGQIDHLRNKYEIKVDGESIRPGEQIYEKMISGFYIVDIYKLILKDVQSMGYNVNIDIESVTGEVLSTLAKEAGGLVNGSIFKHENSLELILAKALCERVALIAAAGLSAIVKHMDRPKVVISADGSVIQKNQFIRESIEKYLKSLLPNVETSIVLVCDGSGTGAAILASTLN